MPTSNYLRDEIINFVLFLLDHFPEVQALGLLRASLTSNSALNSGLVDFVKTPKQESVDLQAPIASPTPAMAC